MNPQDAPALKALLMIVAQTIQHEGLPHLGDDQQGRVRHALQILARVAAQLETDAAPPTDTAQAEGARRQQDDARGAALIERLLGGTTAAPAARGVDAARVQAYLQRHPLGGEAVRVASARTLPGGRSKQTILVTQHGARELPMHLVIRQDWAGSVTGTTVAGEFEVLGRLFNAGIRVPRPLFVEPDAQALGAPFIVVERRAGRSRSHQYQAPEAAACALQLADQLGRVHALDPALFEGLPGIDERGTGTAPLQAQLAGFRAVIDKLQQPPSALVNAALTGLEATVHHVTGPRTLVHGDVSFHNCLCEGDDLTAVLDWEMTHLGNPALDLGYLRVAIERAVPWDDFMQRYRAAGGPALAGVTIDWYSLYGIVWFHHMVLQARAGIAMGVVQDIEVATVCADVGPQALALMAPALARLQGSAA